ncbi:GNAT family N-acetyltransferase [Paenibacillus foliorum]|uniref:GNAT family N-acetyltransferase n=1 Tax=Paenibacillus foliorum TaxID=2654974 RepID=UPI0014928DCA|nr:GNAT family N-acetyltransferase [Paenibacillus foliorum]
MKQLKDIVIRRIDWLDARELSQLLRESEDEGFRLVKRLVSEFESGHNRFDQPGEVLYGAYEDNQLIGICGLNQDPYLQDRTTGRVRRLYVLPAYRRRRIGHKLVKVVTGYAQDYYVRLTLKTDNPLAAQFYEKLGFHSNDPTPHSTHYIDLFHSEDRIATQTPF